MIEKLKALPLLQKLRTLRMNKYWALGLVAALLLGSLLIAPGGRELPEPIPESSDTVPATAATAQTEPPAPPAAPTGLRAVEGLELLPEESVEGVCLDGDGAAVLLTRWDEDAQVWRDRLVELDPAACAVVSVTQMEPYGERLNGALLELTKGEICYVDPEQERCLAFDRQGRFLGLRDHPVMSRENLGWRNRLLGQDCLRKEAGWAELNRGDSGELNRVVAFYDETDRLHVVGEPYDQIQAVLGHRLLTLALPEGGGQDLALLDLDQNLCLDQLALRAEDWPGAEWINLDASALGEDWALLSLSWEGQEMGRSLCFWYPDSGNAAPIQAEALTEQNLVDEIGVLEGRLAAEGILLHLDQAPDPDMTPTTGLSVAQNACETGASLFGQFWILNQLADFVEKLPAGMVREMTSGFPGGDPADRDGLHIYIVRNIPGDAAAFASAWTEPMLICFATEEFSQTHLAHEFMHVMDFRLSQYLYSVRRDLEEEWWALSPNYAYNTELTPEEDEALQDYFVSWYARTNSAEDRAESFQQLFDAQPPLEEAWWWGKAGVRAKLAYLAENLRAAFPSVQATEQAWWEKLPAQ